METPEMSDTFKKCFWIAAVCAIVFDLFDIFQLTQKSEKHS